MQRLQIGCLELRGFLVEVFGSQDRSAECLVNICIGYPHLKLRDCIKTLDFWRPLETQKLLKLAIRFPNVLLALGSWSPCQPHSLLFVFSFTLSGPGRQLSLFIYLKSFNQHKSATIYFGLVQQQYRQHWKHGTKLRLSLNNFVLSVVNTLGLREFGSFLPRDKASPAELLESPKPLRLFSRLILRNLILKEHH